MDYHSLMSFVMHECFYSMKDGITNKLFFFFLL